MDNREFDISSEIYKMGAALEAAGYRYENPEIEATTYTFSLDSVADGSEKAKKVNIDSNSCVWSARKEPYIVEGVGVRSLMSFIKDRLPKDYEKIGEGVFAEKYYSALAENFNKSRELLSVESEELLRKEMLDNCLNLVDTFENSRVTMSVASVGDFSVSMDTQTLTMKAKGSENTQHEKEVDITKGFVDNIEALTAEIRKHHRANQAAAESIRSHGR